jgi:amino acid adenylation domain-containing protein/non-ribosomal peptide synthase protein (TIGR01720 family)
MMQVRKDVETFYPLSPMQQGMLFHCLLEPGSGVYFEQMACSLAGRLDQPSFEKAWQRVVDRHPALRTAFLYEGLKEPVQVVHRRVRVEVSFHDWSDLPPMRRQSRVEEFLAQDRDRGFSLAEPPLMRLTLIQTGESRSDFIWSYHHLLLDGWSVPIVIGEVLHCYEAFRQGKEPRLPPIRSYRDYIVWTRKQDASKAAAFWSGYLKGLGGPTQLPIRRLQASSQHPECSRSAEEEIWLDSDASGALDRFRRRHGLTANTLVQSAWALLLARYSGEEDVVFGVTVSGRPPHLEGVESIVGLFINTLPLRVRVSPDRPVLSWLKDIQGQALSMRDYEYCSLVQIQGWSEVPRGTPLFESILVYENYPAETLRSEGDHLQITGFRSVEQTNYPLAFIAGTADRFLLKISYDQTRFEADSIRRMLGHLETLLTQMASDPGRPLWKLTTLPSAERMRLLSEWNGSQASYPMDRCVHQLMEAQTAETPDSAAVQYGDEVISYGELNRRANRVAAHLRSMGVGPESIVGICMERRNEMAMAILGVLKAGAAYLPLDPSYPPERLRFMVEDSGVGVILTQQKLSALSGQISEAGGQRSEVRGQDSGFRPWTLDPGPWTSVFLDADWPAIALECDENPDVDIDPSNLAYVIYTSGSTGRPKGVMVQHRGVSNLTHALMGLFDMSPRSRVLQFASFGFDASVTEFFPTFAAGGAMYFAPQEVLSSSPELLELMRREGIGIVTLPPSLLSILQADEVPGIETLISAGEPCSWEIVSKWAPGRRFLNGYGPTETTVSASFYPAAEDRSGEIGGVPIGRTNPNTRVYVLARDLQPVPVGVRGEIHVGGVCLSRGYLGRADLTAERFVPCPFPEGASGGERLYRTGDLAHYLPDGNLEFLGRIDHQVKIRGYRIELGEIESALVEHPAVDHATVVASGDTPARLRLVAYVVSESAGRVSDSELLEFLRGKLPAYMVPAAFVTLDRLPLGPSGKVDRKALPAPPEFRTDVIGAYVAPGDAVEEILAGIWAQVLGTDPVGIHDNFFDLGGHSLLATQIMSRVQKAFHLEMPLRTLFEAPTVEGLAAKIRSAVSGAEGIAAPPIRRVSRGQPLPLSFSQQRLWFLDRLDPGSPAYNIPSAVRMRGKLDIGALERAINEMIRRHEVLRTRFPAVEGSPRQEIEPEVRLRLHVDDLSRLPQPQRDREMMRIIGRESGRPFDLARGPLLRFSLIRLDDEDHVAVLTMHHIISDGWSMRLFIGEVASLYEACAAGETPPPPAQAVQYADFAVWQREWLQGEVLERQRSYWLEKLKGLPPSLNLPLDRSRPPFQTSRGMTISFEVDGEVLERVKTLSRKAGATPFMTLLAAFKALLSLYTGQDDIVLGTVIANRNRTEIEGIIGFFVNTLVLRTDLSGTPSFREILDRVRETTLGAYARQDMPFEKLVDALLPERDMSRHPLFQVMFDFQSVQKPSRELSSLTLSPMEVESGIAQFDLSLSMLEHGEGVTGTFEFNTDLFDAKTVEIMAGNLLRLLEGVTADPDRPLSDVPLVQGADEERLLSHWNSTDRDWSQDSCVHTLIEEQARLTPDAVAVVWKEESLSYRELNRRANRLAHYLIKRGVGPEERVGIGVERCPEMIVSILGVLKAGGAYLPLDPSYPPERLRFMVEDSGVGVILTQQKLSALSGQLSEAGGQRSEVIGQDSGFRPWTLDPGPWTPVFLDTDWPLIALESDENPDVDIDPSSLAYVIYTSGSTGTPKGVMVTHRGVVNHNLAVTDCFGLQSCDRVLQFATIGFDAAVEEIFPTLMAGATLILRPDDLPLSGNEMAALTEREDLTLLDLPTAYWHEWAYELSLSARGMPESLRLVAVGGENPSPERLALWETVSGPHVSWMNTYGPTEGAVIATLYEKSRGTERSGPGWRIPIGRPIANMRTYILDARQRPVPVGVTGELYIGGPGVARGYFNRPDRTAEAFVPDPFESEVGGQAVGWVERSETHQKAQPEGRIRGQRSEIRDQGPAFDTTNDIQDATFNLQPATHESQPAGYNPQPETCNPQPGRERLYRTGDLARYLPDGNLEYVGRIDHQVKIRGYRVELGEIETVLRQHPGIRDVVAVIQDGQGSAGPKRLAAYLVSSGEGTPPTLHDLKGFLHDRLPDYMIPATFMFVDGLPLTPTGKVDRRALPDPEPEPSDPETAHVAPRTPEERVLARIWTGLLGLSHVGIHDNFFASGGDSILCIQLIARAHEAGLHLTPRQVFDGPTIAGMAAAANTAEQVGAEQGILEGPVALTPVQIEFFQHHCTNPHHFNTSLLLETRIPMEVDRLEQAFDELTRHHDALRMRFQKTPSGWDQFYAGHGEPLPLIHLDLSGLPQGEEREAVEAACSQLQSSLNLSTGPLMRVAYLDLGANRPARLLAIFHHLIMDGVSLRIVTEDFQSAYRQSIEGRQVRLPPKTGSFRSWSTSLHELAQSPGLLDELGYWTSLGAKRTTDLPVDYPGGMNSYGSMDRMDSSMSDSETRALLVDVPSCSGIQVQELLLTGLVKTFSRRTGSRDLLVETEGHGREEIVPGLDVSRTVGWFTSVFPALLDLGPDPHPRAQLQAIKEQWRGIPNRGIGYGLLRFLREDPRVRERLTLLPRPQVNFNYLGQFDRWTERAVGDEWSEWRNAVRIADESPGPEQSPEDTPGPLLHIIAIVAGGQLNLRWLYSRNLYKPDTIHQLAQDYLQEVRLLLACTLPSSFPEQNVGTMLPK